MNCTECAKLIEGCNLVRINFSDGEKMVMRHIDDGLTVADLTNEKYGIHMHYSFSGTPSEIIAGFEDAETILIDEYEAYNES